MEMSKPSAKVLYDYLLNMGHEWVIETYSLSWEEIDDILYGGALPTPERQKKKIKKQRRIDEAKGVILHQYYRDHFIWDEPNSTHKRCMEIDGGDAVYATYDDELLSRYREDIRRYHMRYGVGMHPHGWVSGEQEINKNTSKTRLDILQDIYLRLILSGDVAEKGKIDTQVSLKFLKEKADNMADCNLE